MRRLALVLLLSGGCLDYGRLTAGHDGAVIVYPNDGKADAVAPVNDFAITETRDAAVDAGGASDLSTSPDLAIDPCTVPHVLVYRMIGTDLSHHCYTTNPLTNCVSYTTETGTSMFYVATASATGLIPLFQCKNLDAGVGYRLTTDANCEEWGATYFDGLVGYIPAAPMCGSTQLYRRFVTASNSYFYTIADLEATVGISAGPSYSAWAM